MGAGNGGTTITSRIPWYCSVGTGRTGHTIVVFVTPLVLEGVTVPHYPSGRRVIVSSDLPLRPEDEVDWYYFTARGKGQSGHSLPPTILSSRSQSIEL